MISQEKPRVLIVDDKENWRAALCDVLESAYDIETAANYEDAKRRLWRRAFHVLVADQRLVDPDTNNIEGILLLDELAKLHDGTQAIIVTGYPTVAAAKKALRGRDAFDYLLKHPEEGGPFNIREYRTRVKEAAEWAMQVRQKVTTLGFSVSNVVSNLTYDRIARTLSTEDATTHNASENAKKVINRLLYPFQPLAPGVGSVHLSEQDQTCEILCWSRGHGKAAMVRIGKELRSLISRNVEWLTGSWPVVKAEEFASAPLIGISYTIDGMEFDNLASQVEDK